MIVTKYLGPTEKQGARISVCDTDGVRRKVFGWDHALDSSENHAKAAQKWAWYHEIRPTEFVGWSCGTTNKGYQFIPADAHVRFKL